MKRTKPEKPTTTGGTDQVDARGRRRAIERWENEGGTPEPTEEQSLGTHPSSRLSLAGHDDRARRA
jgi:hypothetical protein